MHKTLSSKVIFVTGSTKGIGAGIARCLYDQGASVIVSGRDTKAGADVCNQMSDKNRVMYIQLDISDPNECDRAIRQVIKEHGKLDGLVNNAGIFPNATLLETDEKLFNNVFNVNIRGAFFCSRAALGYMISDKGGSIVHIGSTHAYGGSKTLAAYSCSKGALKTLSQHIAHNYASYKIRSNWITVGWVMTEGEKDKAEKLEISTKKYKSVGINKMPMGRLQTSEEIGKTVCFLMSDDAQSITGTEIQITGGYYPI